MTLTPDDLQWLDRLGVDARRMKTITKNQEDAAQWKFYYDGGLNGLMDIKERLKKRIEFLEKDNYNLGELSELLKILGKENVPK